MMIDGIKYLVFSSQEEAVTANLKIYENLARTKAEVIRSANDEVIDPSTVADGDLVAMVYTMPGYKNGAIQIEDGNTTAYALIHECENSDGYVIPKPIDSLMTGVVYDSIEDYNAAWYPDETI